MNIWVTRIKNVSSSSCKAFMSNADWRNVAMRLRIYLFCTDFLHSYIILISGTQLYLQERFNQFEHQKVWHFLQECLFSHSLGYHGGRDPNNLHWLSPKTTVAKFVLELNDDFWWVERNGLKGCYHISTIWNDEKGLREMWLVHPEQYPWQVIQL